MKSIEGLVGVRWSPKSHETRDFLARNGIPYQWLDAESDKEAKGLEEYATTSHDGVASSHLPLVLFQDGSHLSEPTNSQIADKI